jgi:hypothetical protein
MAALFVSPTIGLGVLDHLYPLCTSHFKAKHRFAKPDIMRHPNRARYDI